MANKTIVGIDPGASGGIAVYKNRFATAVKMPSDTDRMNEYFGFLRDNNEDLIVFVEKVQAHKDDKNDPGKNFGINKMLANYQELKTLLKINKIPFCEVYPVSWQSTLQLSARGVEKKIRKEKYRLYAQQCFPELKVVLYSADALCLVRFGMEKLMSDPDWIKERLIGVPSPNLFK